jgi:hypothetical protein
VGLRLHGVLLAVTRLRRAAACGRRHWRCSSSSWCSPRGHSASTYGGFRLPAFALLFVFMVFSSPSLGFVVRRLAAAGLRVALRLHRRSPGGHSASACGILRPPALALVLDFIVRLLSQLAAFADVLSLTGDRRPSRCSSSSSSFSCRSLGFDVRRLAAAGLGVGPGLHGSSPSVHSRDDRPTSGSCGHGRGPDGPGPSRRTGGLATIDRLDAMRLPGAESARSHTAAGLHSPHLPPCCPMTRRNARPRLRPPPVTRRETEIELG